MKKYIADLCGICATASIGYGIWGYDPRLSYIIIGSIVLLAAISFGVNSE